MEEYLLPFYLLVLGIVLFWLNTKTHRSGLPKIVTYVGGWLALVFSVVFAVVKLV